MPIPSHGITEDIHSFVENLFDSLTPSNLQKDMIELYQMFKEQYYPLTLRQQEELDECITTEIMNRCYQYDTAISVHRNFRIQTLDGTYYRMDPDNESGYFVTTNDWYIVEHCPDHWEMYPTHSRIIIGNKGITRIYE
jgi:hypothetical protein